MRTSIGHAKTRGDILEVRDLAEFHLREVQRVQGNEAPWIPAIADAVGVALLELLDECNERLELMDIDPITLPARPVVAMAFNFLIENTIDDDECPF